MLKKYFLIVAAWTFHVFLGPPPTTTHPNPHLQLAVSPKVKAPQTTFLGVNPHLDNPQLDYPQLDWTQLDLDYPHLDNPQLDYLQLDYPQLDYPQLD